VLHGLELEPCRNDRGESAHRARILLAEFGWGDLRLQNRVAVHMLVRLGVRCVLRTVVIIYALLYILRFL